MQRKTKSLFSLIKKENVNTNDSSANISIKKLKKELKALNHNI